MLMLVLFLVVIPLYIYAMSFMRLKQTDKSELRVNMYASTYSSGKRTLIYKTIARLAGEDPNSTMYTVMADEPFIGTIALAFERSRSMYDYHAGVGKEENYEPHPFESRWFHWPLLLRVIWYDSFSTSHKDYSTKMVRGVVAIGNPLLFWFGLPCILFLIWGAIEERRVGLLFVSVGFLFMYLPWVISPRQVTFLYHYLPAQPFMCIGVAYTMDDFWRDRRTRWLCALFVLGVVLVFLYFYPWLNDISLSERGFNSRSWGGKWGVGY
jgi:dolichyl-phosphate-mannose--protein O-mannosyl transferase